MRDYFKTIYKTLLVLAAGLCCAFSLQAQDSLRILFIGNSYTFGNNMPQVVAGISQHLPVTLITHRSTAGGAKLSDHWHGRKGLKTRERLSQETFDIVVLQGHSMSTIREPDSLAKYVKLFCEIIKPSGAKIYLKQTWAREKVPQYQETITQVYGAIAEENGLSVIPLGELWKASFATRPKLELFHPDGSHPSRLGTFLNACFMSAFFSNSSLPVDIPRSYRTRDYAGEPIELISVDGLDKVFCVKMVHQFLAID